MKFTIGHTYLIPGVILALASCTHEGPDNPVGESNRIFFLTSLPALITRGEATDAQNIREFYVTGFDVESARTEGGLMNPLFEYGKVETSTGVTNSDGTTVFSSSECTWPAAGKENNLISFVAFSPGLEKLGENSVLINNSTADNLDYKLTGFSINPDIAAHADFITAYTTGTMKNNKSTGINLPFVHQLSRIEVKAFSAHLSCDIEIAGVRIGGIHTGGTFSFPANNGFGSWSELVKSGENKVDYIYGADDYIISLPRGDRETSTEKGAVSIMGNLYANGNGAMLIPYSSHKAWEFGSDGKNEGKNLYISVLIRVSDATPTAGSNGKNRQLYPYKNTDEGEDALDIPRVYMAVKKATNRISRRLYEKDNIYYSNEGCTVEYALPADEEVKEFGWAALPVTGSWSPGYIYTYILNYSGGVGLHDPGVKTNFPKAGDPILNDQILWDVTVDKWKYPDNGGNSSVDVPGS